MLVVGLVVFFLRAHTSPCAHVLVGARPVIREALLGIACCRRSSCSCCWCSSSILRFAPQLHNVARNPLEDMLRNRRDALIFAVVVMIAGGVREEMQRGFILHRFEPVSRRRRVGVMPSTASSSASATSSRARRGDRHRPARRDLGLIYVARRSIVAPMVSHAGFNLAQLIKF